MAKTKPFDTSLIDKDLTGIILVSYFSPSSAGSAIAQIRKMVPKIPIVRLKWLLEDSIEKLSGILLCKQELKEKADMEQAVKNLKKLECRFGNRSILHICIKPDIRKTLTNALADAEKQKKTEPETEGILLRTVQETFCLHRHMKEWAKFCEDEQITNLLIEESDTAAMTKIGQTAVQFCNRFLRRRLVRPEEWAEELPMKDLVYLVPNHGEPETRNDGGVSLEEMAGRLALYQLLETKPMEDCLVMNILREKIERDAENNPPPADYIGYDPAEIAENICKTLACRQNIPRHSLNHADDFFPDCGSFGHIMDLPAIDEAQAKTNLEKFMLAAGSEPKNITQFACVLKSLMEPAGSTGYGVLLSLPARPEIRVQLSGILDKIAYMDEGIVPSAVYDTVKVKYVNEASLKQHAAPSLEAMLPDGKTENKVLAAIYGRPGTPIQSSRILSINLFPGISEQETNDILEHTAKILEMPQARTTLVNWIQKWSYDRKTKNYFGIKELLAGKLPDNGIAYYMLTGQEEDA